MKKIPVSLKLFDPTLPPPQYHSTDAAGFDLYSRLDAVIQPQQTVMLPTNIAIDIPADYWLLIAARSSLYRRGLQLINGIGVLDPDFCGDDDEAQLVLYNFSAQPVTITKGERLAQAILIPRLRADFHLTSQLTSSSRGGFGSTGK